MFRTTDEKARKIKQKAEEAYAQQKWEKALEHYLQLQETGSFDPRIGQRVGDLFRRKGNSSLAIEEYKKVGRYYQQKGFWAKAVAMQKMVLELDPTDVTVQKELARLYSSQSAQQTLVPLPQASQERSSSPSSFDDLIGGTISIAEEEPRTWEDPPKEVGEGILLEEKSSSHLLGSPLPSTISIPLFSEMSRDELFSTLERLRVHKFPSGSFVCQEGDPGDCLYLISEGCAEISTQDKKGNKVVLAQLHGGEFFGEYGLLTQSKRTASVQALTDLELLEITSRDFDVIAAQHPRVWTLLEDHLRNRILDSIFAKSPVFRVLSKEARTQIFQKVSLRKVKANQTIMLQGSEGDEMFFVKSGFFSVLSQKGNDRVLVGELGPGDYFGEVAMLSGKPRTATIQAKTEGELFCLSRLAAAKVFASNPDLLLSLKTQMEERFRETAESLQSYEEAQTTLDLV